jgi:HK97 family phage portal protein
LARSISNSPMANIFARALERITGKAAPSIAGEPRPGPYWLPITGAWLPASVGQFWNWWQMGYDPVAPAPSAMVEACISAYAQTIAMLPGDQWLANDLGGRERRTTTAASRLLRRPNSYQTASDFIFNAVRQLFLTGNAYAVALRNDRFEISELHLMHSRSSGVRVAVTGDVFYHLAGNEVLEARLGQTADQLLAAVPQRDVLHIRLNTPRHPLIGESPLLAALPDVAAAGAMTAQQLAYYVNQARPSMVLTTDLPLDADANKLLRELWNAQAQGLNAGGTPILSHGLKPEKLSGNADEGQFVETLDVTDRHIALALGVPLQVLGAGKTAPFASTEALMQFWLARGLGFVLNHVESAFDRLFGLAGPPDEYIAFDTGMLLRSAERERMAALSDSIRGGIRTINEARATEQLPRVTGGDEIRVQQQDVPLDWHQQQAEAAAAAAPPPPPAADDEDEEEEPDERTIGEWARELLDAADAIDRRAA